MKESINHIRCKEIVEKMHTYYQNNSNIATIDYPHNIIFSSNQYFIYMFYSCLLDYGMKSSLYHANLVKTYKKYPNIFDPSASQDIKEEKLKEIIINNIHPRYPNIATKKWRRLSNFLCQYENLRKQVESFNSFDELKNFIKLSSCYGQKTGGLLLRIICDSKICHFSEEIKCIPIDRHDIEISYNTGVIDNIKLSKKEIDNLSSAYIKASQNLKISPSDTDKYLWEIGSKLCSKNKCANCPIANYCKKSGSYIIRKATKKDVSALSILKQKVWDQTYRGIYSDEIIDNYDYKEKEKGFLNIINNKNMVLYVVEHQNTLVGYMCYGYPKRAFQSYEQELSLLYLTKDFQKKGLGKKLFNMAVKDMKEKGYKNFFLSCNKYNINARKFYEKMGGKIIYEDEDAQDKRFVQVKYHYDI